MVAAAARVVATRAGSTTVRASPSPRQEAALVPEPEQVWLTVVNGVLGWRRRDLKLL